MHDSKSLTIEHIVVHVLKTSICLFFGVELEVTITKWLASSLMEHNFCTLKSETMAGEQFEEIEIKEVFLWKVADIQAGELVLLFFANWSSAGISKRKILELLIELLTGELHGCGITDVGTGIHLRDLLLLLHSVDLGGNLLHHLLGDHLSLLLGGLHVHHFDIASC